MEDYIIAYTIDCGGSSIMPLSKFDIICLKIDDYLIRVVKKIKELFY